MRKTLATILAFIYSASLPAQAPTSPSVPNNSPTQAKIAGFDVKALLKDIDELYRSTGSKGRMAMAIETPDWSRTIKMAIWTKGEKYTFIRIEEPRKEKGVSFLKRDKSIWNFFPKINKVIKVPPSMMMASWMGSDFTNDDLVKDSTLIEDYKVKNQAETAKQLTFELIPSKTAISLWGKIVVTVDKASRLPVTQVFYDERGEKIRTMTFKDIGLLGKRQLPKTLELIPHTKTGYRTTIRYLDMTFDANNPDSVFTLQNLQSRR